MSHTQIGASPGAAPRSRLVTLFLLAFTLVAAGVTLVLPASGTAHAITRASQTMYTPPSGAPSPGSLYPRALRLQHSGSSNGTMLATFEQSTSGTPVFPIYRSTDNGNTWTQISSIADTQNGWGMRWEPFLYELPTAIGNFPAGTILAAGDSVPSDRSATKIDMYASTDHGVTWTFVSNIATGGQAISSNGYTPVWEPFLMVYNNQLVVYYSDQRDPSYGQKLVHQVSTNGVTWGSVVNDVAVSPYSARPGMTTVAQMGNGDYIMTYEYGGSPNGNYAVYYKISANPLDFGSATGIPLKTTGGITPTSSPYVVWMPTGGTNGTLVVSANSTGELFLNTQAGAANTWTEIPSNVTAGYSRGMVPLSDGHSLEVFSGGPLRSSGLNSVTYSTIDLGGGWIGAGSNRCLDVPSNSTTNGTLLDIWDCNGGANQGWNLLSNGELQVYGSKCLDVPNQSTASGTKVDIWSCNGGANQLWTLNSNGTLVGRQSGLCLDVTGAGTANGTAVDIWTCNGASNQKWTQQP
jgi:hypothetical protein